MAFTSIVEGTIEVGKAIKKALFTQIKNNFDDHESRINNVEAGAGKVIVADFEVVGYISHYSAAELLGIATFRAPSAFKLLEFTITIMNSANGFDSGGNPVTSSSAGVLQLDLKKSTNNGATYTSILSRKPSVDAGYYAAGTSSNSSGNTSVIFASTSLNQDDMLRIDVTGLKDTQGSFHISCYGSLD